MKKFFTFIIAMAVTLSVQAQSTLGSRLAHQLKIYNMHKANAARGLNAVPVMKTITVIGTLKDGEECPTEELAKLGVKVRSQHFGMVAMEVSMDKLESLCKVTAFRIINANSKHSFQNKASRERDHVNDVQDAAIAEEEGLPQTYTGKGVIVGVIDKGFDFPHKNFKDADGNARIKRVWIDGVEYNTPEDIAALTTDDTTSSHGTHTTGTAAGSYDGEYTYGSGAKESGLQGTAYESELLLSSGLSDEYIFDALDSMKKYAQAQNKPLAINMSIGSNDVWMDGKNTRTTAFKKVSEDGNAKGLIMCVAAGNEGGDHASFYKHLDAGDKVATEITFDKKAVRDYDIQIASDDATPFSVKLIGYDENGEVKKTYTLDQEAGDLFSTLSYSSGYAEDHDGRFNIEISGESDGFEMESGVTDYVLEISADKACDMRFFAKEVSGSNTLNGEEKSDLFTPDDSNSLNRLAQNKYVFSVGAYASQTIVRTWTGIYTSNSLCATAITPFSSWVSVPCGNKDSICVDFLAPGSLVLSSINHFDENNAEYLSAKADDNTLLGWMEGTSMAAPNATGIMALWLEADPTLTITRAREIVKATADNDYYTSDVRRAGLGRLNCLEGLKMVLNTSAIHNIDDDTSTSSAQAQHCKVIKNGKLVIIKNGKQFNVAGQQM